MEEGGAGTDGWGKEGAGEGVGEDEGVGRRREEKGGVV